MTPISSRHKRTLKIVTRKAAANIIMNSDQRMIDDPSPTLKLKMMPEVQLDFINCKRTTKGASKVQSEVGRSRKGTEGSMGYKQSKVSDVKEEEIKIPMCKIENQAGGPPGTLPCIADGGFGSSYMSNQ